MFLKQRLRKGEILRGPISVIPSPVATQAIAAAGADFVVLDREHGPIGPEAMHAMIAATAGTACAPLVRVPRIDAAEVKTALDAGAEGVLFPLVRTVADAQAAVSFTRYPPDGVRGWAPLVAHARHGVALMDYAGEVAPHLTCVLFIETLEALADIDAILAVPGIDLAFLAPFDLSMALGIPGQFGAPEFTAAAATVERAAAAAGVPLGSVALEPARYADLVARDYRFFLTAFDTAVLGEQVAAAMAWG
jgi:4-hydroxy-2-oxoheptanedioate aldolase